MTYFAYIPPAHQLTFTLFPPFFPFLSTLVSHFIPNFPLHLLASHSALPPNSSPSLLPCPAAQTITQEQRCLFLYLLASLFQGCTPSALQRILHLKDFWLKQSELKVQKLLPRQNLLLEWEDFSLVEFSPLPEDVSRLLCSQVSCKEKPTRCKQSDQARENRRPPCLTSKACHGHAELVQLKRVSSAINTHQHVALAHLCNAREGSNMQEGIAGESTHCRITTFKIQPVPPHFCAI